MKYFSQSKLDVQSNFFLYSIYIASFVSFFIINKTFYFNIFFESLLILIFLFNFNGKTIKKIVTSFFLLNIAYLSISFLYSVSYNGDNVKDFLLIYKTFIYLIILPFIIDYKILSLKSFLVFFKFIVSLFLAKYIISKLFFDQHRPIVFAENNFELMFLALLLYLYFIVKGKVEFVYQFAIAVIYLLSASISGILILIFVLSVINYRLIKKKSVYVLVALIILTLLAVIVLKERTNGSLDLTTNTRYEFLLIFFNETRDWNVIDFLFGSGRITALSEYACYSQYYWTSGLFSYNNNGQCYSVILHSYLLRVIFDHGILGFLFIILFTIKIIINAGYKYKDALVIIGIAIINGLSVSAFNSIYFITGIVFYLILKRRICSL